jgi:hypothetical protein
MNKEKLLQKLPKKYRDRVQDFSVEYGLIDDCKYILVFTDGYTWNGCDYFLGYGNRYAGHLWAKNIDEQIEEMKRLWNLFDDDKKPEWLTLEEIEEYERAMLSE